MTHSKLPPLHYTDPAGLTTRLDQPLSYRLARKPDGTLILQGAVRWRRGSEGGVTWREIPTVQLKEPP